MTKDKRTFLLHINALPSGPTQKAALLEMGNVCNDHKNIVSFKARRVTAKNIDDGCYSVLMRHECAQRYNDGILIKRFATLGFFSQVLL